MSEQSLLPSGESVNEEWRPIAGYEGIYEISSHGRVRSLDRIDCAGRRLRGSMMRPGRGRNCPYFGLNLSKNASIRSHYVHDLVAAAFIGPKPAGKEVNHKDRRKENCRADNLEYITHAENVSHTYATGRVVPRGDDHYRRRHPEAVPRGMAHSKAKLNDAQVREIRRLLATGCSMGSLARQFGVRVGSVQAIAVGRTWKHVV